MSAYIKFENIKKGDSKAKGHEGDKGWIEIQSIQFGASRNITTRAGASSTREASAPHISEIVITKVMDSTSTGLFQEAVIGKAGKAEIDLCTTHAEKLENYLQVTLTNVLISSYNVSHGGDGRPSESVTLNFTKIEIKYTPYDDKHVAGTPTSATYDQSTATK
jgi:type VI secretion system secreted protein Hcp